MVDHLLAEPNPAPAFSQSARNRKHFLRASLSRREPLFEQGDDLAVKASPMPDGAFFEILVELRWDILDCNVDGHNVLAMVA